MPLRTTFSNLSTPPLAGTSFLAEYAERLKSLFDASAFPLTNVAGTGNAVTADLDPPLDAGGLVNGMKFTLTWAASNTGAVTLAINGGTAVPVVDADNAALSASTLVAGRRSLIEYISGSFRILSSAGGGAAGAGPAYQAFTASGTWTKPSGYDPDTQVLVELWAAGGAGGRGASGNGNPGGGGGGGGYVAKLYRIADLPSSVSIAIGAGGTPGGAQNTDGGNGGNSTFGSLMTAYGGSGGGSVTGSGGVAGGGGGTIAAGVLGGSGRGGGGPSGSGILGNNDATGLWGGGGGKTSTTAGSGGHATYGGGGGGAASAGTGGASAFGGRGGNGAASNVVPESGFAPAGGGAGSIGTATSGAGARGECRVTIFG
jgi:hypothetical protein